MDAWLNQAKSLSSLATNRVQEITKLSTSNSEYKEKRIITYSDGNGEGDGPEICIMGMMHANPKLENV